MTRLQKTALSLLTVLAIGLAGLVGWVYQTKWRQPLGPALQISSVTPIQLPATWTPDPNATVPPLSSSNVVSVNSPSSGPAMCGAPAVMNILAIGSDTRAETYTYGLADVIRLVRVDFVNPKITILEFPRDLWVEIPDIADNLKGQDHEKLNQSYLYGNPGFKYTDDPAGGPGLLARTLTLNFGAQIDHYVAVNMRTFINIVNAVGGIDVTLPESVDGRTADDPGSRLFFRSGTLHLDGNRALTLARIRIEGGFVRGENQNRVLCALRDQLTRPSVVDKIPDLIKSFGDNIQTDLSPEQLGQLACIGTKIEPGNIRFANFPQELFHQTRQHDPVFKKEISILEVDFDILRDYITQFNDGTWPQTSSSNETKGKVSFCP